MDWFSDKLKLVLGKVYLARRPNAKLPTQVEFVVIGERMDHYPCFECSGLGFGHSEVDDSGLEYFGPIPDMGGDEWQM